MLGIEPDPRVAGWEARMLLLYYDTPPHTFCDNSSKLLDLKNIDDVSPTNFNQDLKFHEELLSMFLGKC